MKGNVDLKKERRDIIAPSILACDFTDLGGEVENVLSSGSDWLHVDVMDGHFVQNISIGVPVVSCLHKRVPNAFLDCHLMVSDPLLWVGPMCKAGASQYTFHYEAVDLDFERSIRLLDVIRQFQMRAGIAINPSTPIDQTFTSILLTGKVDTVLVMSVEPGFGGQSFMEEETLRKISLIKNEKQLASIDIQVDGGINPVTAKKVVQAGANILVAGSAIFSAKDQNGRYDDIISSFRSCFDSN